MTTLTHTHIPNKVAISEHNEAQYTFCEDCEQNIYRFWIEDEDRLSFWSEWFITE